MKQERLLRGLRKVVLTLILVCGGMMLSPGIECKAAEKTGYATSVKGDMVFCKILTKEVLSVRAQSSTPFGEASESTSFRPIESAPPVRPESTSPIPTASVSPTLNASKAKNSTKTKKVQTGHWVVKRQAPMYYVNGKKTIGLKRVQKNTYFFDKKGIQRTGWQKIGDRCFFFRIANKKKGYMVKSEKVDGIVLSKNGSAKITGGNREKMKALLQANKIVEKATKPMMKTAKKRRVVFRYALKHFWYSGSLNFNNERGWAEKYALDMFDKKHGNCFAYGAAFAFLANALGDKKCSAVSSGGHGWTEINGKVYDLSWHITDRKHSYYGMDYALSGVDGRPNYKAGRARVARI